MHFGEIWRRLSLNIYLSKEEFENDLNQIWSNCRKYNTEPSSIFVSHASEMEKKQKRVMKKNFEKLSIFDLSPFRDLIQAENSAALSSPVVPRMLMSSSMDGTSSAQGAHSSLRFPLPAGTSSFFFFRPLFVHFFFLSA